MSFPISDEQPHQPGSHEFWNESFYFNFFDNDAGWAGATRIGFSPNRGNADGFICLYFPDGGGGFVRSWRPLSGRSEDVEVAPFRYEMIEPFKTWRVSYEGPVFYFEDTAMMSDFFRTHLSALPTRQMKLDLTFTSRHEAYDFHASGKRKLLPGAKILGKLRPDYLIPHWNGGVHAARSIRAMSGASHYEQACHFEGTIAIDDKEEKISGTGQRDHSWGVRDMRVPTNWRWFSCQFGDELAFNATRVEVLGLEAVGGYAYYQGRAQGLKSWDLEVLRPSADGRWAQEAKLQLQLESGERFTFAIEALTNLPVAIATEGVCTVVNEARARFRWEETGRESYGISEFMEQLYP
ncbi:MAG: hypothetical protein KDH09_17275 [Chrysiogenetes bacterium]|nr:hypothetical protein [Chrysiogenetes bacterium]